MSEQLLVSLTDSSIASDRVSPSRVGGKASSLATLFSTPGLSTNVPKAYALTVDFYKAWIDTIKSSQDFKSLLEVKDDNVVTATHLCNKLQEASYRLELSKAQTEVIQLLVQDMNSKEWNTPKLAAVRSSAPEEDGTGASFAGAFETCLGVAPTIQALEQAIRKCFASLWDYRVIHYKRRTMSPDHQTNIGFCVVVMEMIDSKIAGVAFSANPLNSDRDEMVVDSSWGLGESVVDGSVTADRYIVSKLGEQELIKLAIGEKGNEKRLGDKGGVIDKEVIGTRVGQSTLSKPQLSELTKLVCLVEETYGMPMDIEWAFIDKKGSDTTELKTNPKDGTKYFDGLELKLLQARPITTLYYLDEYMMTKPDEARKLYFDANIVSEATTTNPFTRMDITFFSKAACAIMGVPFAEAEKKDFGFWADNPDMLMFNGAFSSFYIRIGLPTHILYHRNVLYD